MIKTTVMPKETLVQFLLFIAENEKFSSVSENLAGGITVEEARASLRELAKELGKEASTEQGADADAKLHLSRKAKEVISYLSPHEEKTLMTAFGLNEK